MPSLPRFHHLPCFLFVACALTLPSFAAPDAWREEIGRFSALDAVQLPPPAGVVFVGSSSIRLWTTLSSDFPTIPTINRGFGGSELADSVYYADRIVVPYQPRLVVLYAGENDINAGKPPATVLADFQAFRTKIHAALPAAKIIYLSIKESPSRAAVRTNVLECNRLIAADCATDPRCTFVDVATPLLDAAGDYRPELYQADLLHLRPAGYALWTQILTPYLQP